jgi:hypothetical protein
MAHGTYDALEPIRTSAVPVFLTRLAWLKTRAECMPSPDYMHSTDDSLWSFNLRSYNPCDFSDSDSDGPLDNPCSDGSTLVDHPLSEDNDTAEFRPNPWSIARINAASRLAQKYALCS